MVQLWIFLLLKSIPSLYLSEAINNNKTKYYAEIENSRNTYNDLSYFIIYMLKLSNSYYVIYKNLDEIKNKLESEGETISNLELNYLKQIILNKKVKWFNYKKFIEFAGLDVSKQGALKILNGFEKKNLLNSKINSSREKIFVLNDLIIKYELK